MLKRAEQAKAVLDITVHGLGCVASRHGEAATNFLSFFKCHNIRRQRHSGGLTSQGPRR